MRRYWMSLRDRIDGMALRERIIVFAAATLVLIAVAGNLLLAPLQARQTELSGQLVQQQEKMKELHAQMRELLQARRDDERSPLKLRIDQLRQQLREQDMYLQDRREHLVEPAGMAQLLEQVLHENGAVKLVELKTLPVGLLLEQGEERAQPVAADGRKQIFRHGVQITVRGSYLDLMRYAAALEKLPSQMFWGEAKLSVEQYPDAQLTLTVYTLSLDQVWLSI